MSYDCHHKVRQGLHIVGKGKSIDVIVKKIGGGRRSRTANLEIKGVNDLNSLELGPSNDLAELDDGLMIGIKKTKHESNRVAISYHAERRDYKFTRCSYEGPNRIPIGSPPSKRKSKRNQKCN